MTRYYTDGTGRRVTRVSDGYAEVWNQHGDSWEFDQDFYDTCIGELSLDEISEGEAFEIIARRKGEVHSG